MNARDLIEILRIFKKEAIQMKPLRFWAIWSTVTGSAVMYLLPGFLAAVR